MAAKVDKENIFSINKTKLLTLRSIVISYVKSIFRDISCIDSNLSTILVNVDGIACNVHLLMVKKAKF